jgi:hypothetical protein
MARLDLDARRAEANSDPHVVQLGGHDYELPPKLPLALAQYLVEGRTVDAIRILFGDDAAPAVERLLTDDDLDAIARQLYGVTPGEARPALARSPTNGARSNPTFVASTPSG